MAKAHFAHETSEVGVPSLKRFGDSSIAASAVPLIILQQNVPTTTGIATTFPLSHNEELVGTTATNSFSRSHWLPREDISETSTDIEQSWVAAGRAAASWAAQHVQCIQLATDRKVAIVL